MQLLAKTYYGLEEQLAKELTELGAQSVEISRRAVYFEGDKELLYRANLQLHTAIRVLKPIVTFQATSADEVYENLVKFDFSTVMSTQNTFVINETVNSETMRNSQFVKYRAKDAIVDYFKAHFNNARPNISVQNPDFYFDLHVSHSTVTLSLDSSGESLHLRGWRQDQTVAPLSEVLAAGMIRTTGWHGECDLIDPMCGSGTLLIEAALIALNMAPCVYRHHFAFERWDDFDEQLFNDIYNDDSAERPFEHKIYGYDVDARAVMIAQRNVKAAGLGKYIQIEQRSIADFRRPEERALIVTNPPYGRRIVTDDMFDLYRTLGTAFKRQLVGCTAWVISSEKNLLSAIGMKPSAKYKLLNGELECDFCRYEIFAGKREDYVRERVESGEVKPRDFETEEGAEHEQDSREERSERGERREYRRDNRREYHRDGNDRHEYHRDHNDRRDNRYNRPDRDGQNTDRREYRHDGDNRRDNRYNRPNKAEHTTGARPRVRRERIKPEE